MPLPAISTKPPRAFPPLQNPSQVCEREWPRMCMHAHVRGRPHPRACTQGTMAKSVSSHGVMPSQNRTVFASDSTRQRVRRCRWNAEVLQITKTAATLCKSHPRRPAELCLCIDMCVDMCVNMCVYTAESRVCPKPILLCIEGCSPQRRADHSCASIHVPALDRVCPRATGTRTGDEQLRSGGAAQHDGYREHQAHW